jgi:hypothetical protein
VLGLEEVVVLGLAVVAQQALYEQIVGLELEYGRYFFFEKVLSDFVLIGDVLLKVNKRRN